MNKPLSDRIKRKAMIGLEQCKNVMFSDSDLSHPSSLFLDWI
jgi:hypothetical protein